ncbi:MAG: putative tRNA sulfurtransferase [Marine Group II euryarchaeote MED-G33]|nr:MAG: putative tRNA sulfurtransferase [Marine Group II euryarchaeote MED-G33]
MASAPTCIALVSGGIDSPVAVARMVRAGWQIVPVHCSQEPITGTEAEDKTAASLSHLIESLDENGLIDSNLRVVTVGETLAKFTDPDAHRDYFVHMKRLFNSIGSSIAEEVGATAILTGENLGQVSSQTLGNLGAVEEASNYRILRPLLGLDKQEIIDEARVLGTYEISSGPELCDALGPDRPTTVADIARLRQNEGVQGGLENLAKECLESLRMRSLDRK